VLLDGIESNNNQDGGRGWHTQLLTSAVREAVAPEGFPLPETGKTAKHTEHTTNLATILDKMTSQAFDVVDIDAVISHNDELPEAIQESARIFLYNAKRDLSVLCAEFVHITSPPDILRTRRAEMETRVALYRAVIAPHRKLPVETLREIFIRCNPKIALPLMKNFRYRSGLDVLWCISYVCSKWRRIVLETPDLWSDIMILPVRDALYGSERTSTTAFREVLARGRHTLVSLDVCAKYDWLTPVSSFVSPLLGRLKELVLEGGSVWLKPFLTSPKGTVEWLEEIRLTIHGDMHYPITVFEAARRLRRVTLCHVNSSINNPLGYCIPWAQLQDLEIRDWYTIGASRGVALLRQCPSLVRCSLKIAAKPARRLSSSIQKSPVVLRYMKSLSVDILGRTTSANHILGPLTLPSLTQMILIGSKLTWSSEVVAVITQSGNLQMLTLDLPVPTLDVDMIIRKAPSLELLHLPQSTLLASTLQLMSGGEIVPKLDNLRCNVNEGMLDVHFDLLESRGVLQSCTKITTVELFVLTDSLYYGNHEARVEKLREQGWNITIDFDFGSDVSDVGWSPRDGD